MRRFAIHTRIKFIAAFLLTGLFLTVGLLLISKTAALIVLLVTGTGVTLLLWTLAKRLEGERKSADLKTAYLANMTHELRAPMHIILNFTRLVLDGHMGELNEAQIASLKQVMESASHLLAVINDVLDVAKIEAGQMSVRPEVLDLKPLLIEMENSARALMLDRGKSLYFRVENAENLPPVKADPMRVRQILLNLIANAIRFTDEGGITLRFENSNGWLTIFVEDTGRGIPPEKLDMIFERFQQGRDSRGGTGLGLTIARDLVHLHGGRIQVTSTPGKGSCFLFTLPLAAA